MAQDEPAQRVKDLAASAGYVACGITTPGPFPEYAEALDRRATRFPSTAALHDQMRYRVDPRLQTPWAKSAVVCIRWYGKYRVHGELPAGIARSYLFDRRNRLCPDHAIPGRMKAGLRALGFRVKTGGVPARAAAVRAGVARFGRNGFVYAGRYGSWVNVETFLVDAELTADQPSTGTACPPGCDACLRSCPTGALVEPGLLRMDHCVAYLTYEAPEPVPDGLWEKMGGCVYGCDRCQEVCPLNRDAWKPLEHASWLEPLLPHLTPEALAAMSDETYRTLVHPSFWYIGVDNAERWRRNARRAIEHTGSSTGAA